MPLPLLLALSAEIDRAALDAAFSAAKSPAPACAAALVRDGRTVWAAGRGATPDTPFRIASLTKAFTAVAVLQLVREGKVALDDPIGRALPDLPEAWRGATVRQLLNHTSGIPSYTARPDFASRIAERLTPAQIVARTKEEPLDFPSGTRFSYDNTGYVVLGLLAERLDARPLADALRSRLFDPLGMAHTRLDPGGKPDAQGFEADGKPAQAIDMSQPYAAGSIVSTASDMARWLAAQDSERLLPKPLWAEVERSGALADGKPTGYGFGWILGSLNGVPTLEHGGGIPGFASYAQRVPAKGLGVIVLTNSEAGDPQRLARRLLETADPSLKASEAAVSDPDPKVTEATRRLLHGFEQGAPDKEAMSADLAALITPEAVESARTFLAGLGAFRELRLTKVDGLRRTYLAIYEKGSAAVLVGRDEGGRFTGFAIRPA